MTYSDFYQILTEAEGRAADETLPELVRANSRETVALCLERMERDGITREQLAAG